jgi:hypothetical protein
VGDDRTLAHETPPRVELLHALPVLAALLGHENHIDVAPSARDRGA